MDISVVISEMTFKTSRSSGPGGQHVNKTSSKVEISFSVVNSRGISETEKRILMESLSSKLTKDGELIIQCSETRSQHRNKAIGIERMLELLVENSQPKVQRRKTKPSKSAKEKRLQQKKKLSQKKADRRPPKTDE